MLIGELAKSLKVTPKTLRHYEKIGLIPAASRSTSGYRVFSEDAIERAQWIVELRKLDLSLEIVREILDDDNNEQTRRQRLMGHLDVLIQEKDLDIALLQGKRDDLQSRYDALLATRGSCNGTCICSALHLPCSCTLPET